MMVWTGLVSWLVLDGVQSIVQINVWSKGDLVMTSHV
jgi:hypothetical protein